LTDVSIPTQNNHQENIETKHKEINNLHPKVDMKQFEEVINQDDTPIEFLNHSAALREPLSINLHCTGSKGGYEPAVFVQLSGKNLDYQSKSGFDAEEVVVNRLKDVNLTNVSITNKAQCNHQENIETEQKEISNLHPKVDMKQFEEVINQDDAPIEFLNHSAALRESLSINLHCIGSKGGYEPAVFT
jgi:hypothetical protein